VLIKDGAVADVKVFRARPELLPGRYRSRY